MDRTIAKATNSKVQVYKTYESLSKKIKNRYFFKAIAVLLGCSDLIKIEEDRSYII